LQPISTGFATLDFGPFWRWYRSLSGW